MHTFQQSNTKNNCFFCTPLTSQPLVCSSLQLQSKVHYIFNRTYRIFKILQSTNCCKLSSLFSIQLCQNLTFHKYCESFIKPEMFKVPVGDQISCPAVADFMSYYISQRPISCLQKQNQTHSKRHSNISRNTIT